MDVTLSNGVKSLGLMKTLMSLFPLVKQVSGNRNMGDAALLAQPYNTWHLLVFDSYLNILLARYQGELVRIPAEDMVILVGPVARAWMNTQLY